MIHLTRQFNILPRLRMLENLQISPPSAEAIKEYREIDRLLVISRTKANASVRCLHMSNVNSSITVKLDRIRIILATLLIQNIYRDRRVKLKTGTKMETFNREKVVDHTILRNTYLSEVQNYKDHQK